MAKSQPNTSSIATLRHLFEALDYAHRTNTIVQESKDWRETIARLNERLDEPFVTINTVTGEDGIKQAQNKYQHLMNNKSPKNRRK